MARAALQAKGPSPAAQVPLQAPAYPWHYQPSFDQNTPWINSSAPMGTGFTQAAQGTATPSSRGYMHQVSAMSPEWHQQWQYQRRQHLQQQHHHQQQQKPVDAQGAMQMPSGQCRQAQGLAMAAQGMNRPISQDMYAKLDFSTEQQQQQSVQPMIGKHQRHVPSQQPQQGLQVGSNGLQRSVNWQSQPGDGQQIQGFAAAQGLQPGYGRQYPGHWTANSSQPLWYPHQNQFLGQQAAVQPLQLQDTPAHSSAALAAAAAAAASAGSPCMHQASYPALQKQHQAPHASQLMHNGAEQQKPVVPMTGSWLPDDQEHSAQQQAQA